MLGDMECPPRGTGCGTNSMIPALHLVSRVVIADYPQAAASDDDDVPIRVVIFDLLLFQVFGQFEGIDNLGGLCNFRSTSTARTQKCVADSPHLRVHGRPPNVSVAIFKQPRVTSDGAGLAVRKASNAGHGLPL